MKKATFDYSVFGMNQSEFKYLSFNMFLRTVEMFDGRLNISEYVSINCDAFARFNIHITPENVVRVLVPSIARAMKKAGEIHLSFVTFKRLLKGEFATRAEFKVAHKAKAPATTKPRPRKAAPVEQGIIETLAAREIALNSGNKLTETELLMLNRPGE